MSDANEALRALQESVVAFRDARDWSQFHTFKNLTAAMNVEAAELLELTQWLTDEMLSAKLGEDQFRKAVSSEIADVLIYLILICDCVDLDLLECAKQKLLENAGKYPVEKARGNSKKYDEL